MPLRVLGTTPHPAANTDPVPPGTGPQATHPDMVALDEGYLTGGQLMAMSSGAGYVLGHLPLSVN